MESAHPLTPQRSHSFPKTSLQTLRGLRDPCASKPDPYVRPTLYLCEDPYQL